VPQGARRDERPSTATNSSTNSARKASCSFVSPRTSPPSYAPLHVDVLELPSDRFVPFLALEWLDGDGLDVIIRRRHEQGKAPLTLEKLIPFLTPVAQALACAHRFPGPDGPVSIIHRDLKPENIFVARSQGGEVVKILDYGIARTRSAATLYAGRITKGGAFDAFTPGYAAPEQWLPKRYGQTGPWTDVWGLALTMVEAMAGRPPIVGDVAAMMGTTVDESLRPTPRAEGVRVSDEIEAIFERALNVDPRRRTQSIEELWTDLERALGLELTFDPNDSKAGSGPALLLNTAPPMASPLPRGLRSPAASSVLVRPVATIDDPFELAPDAPDSSPASRSSSRSPAPTASAATRNASNPVPAPSPSSPSSARNASSSGPAPPPRASTSTPAAERSTPPVTKRAPAPAPSPSRQEPAARATSERIPRAAVMDPAPPGMPLELAYEPPQKAAGELWPASHPGEASVRARLRLPFWLIAFGIGVGVIENVYFRHMGEGLSLGPVRPLWIAGPVALIGVILGGVRLFARNE
jgi:serine/threonine protein kinase